MYTQLEDKSKALLETIKHCPGFNARQLADNLTQTHTMEQVSSALWGLWKGRYVTRKPSETKAGNGMTPFVYFHKTDKPRRKRGKVKRKYVRRVSVQGTSSDQGFRLKAGPKSDVEVSTRVRLRIGKQLFHATMPQTRSLYAALKDLLGV